MADLEDKHLKELRKMVDNTTFKDMTTNETIGNNEELKECIFNMFAESIRNGDLPITKDRKENEE